MGSGRLAFINTVLPELLKKKFNQQLTRIFDGHVVHLRARWSPLIYTGHVTNQ